MAANPVRCTSLSWTIRAIAPTRLPLVRAWRHKTEVAYSGTAALTAALDFLSDVMIVDLAMPVMNGNEVARQIRGMPELLGVILVALTGRFDKLARELFDHHHLN